MTPTGPSEGSQFGPITGRNFLPGAALCFALSALVFWLLPAIRTPVLHTILDTGIFFASGVLAFLLWDVSHRTQDAFSRSLAIALFFVALGELIHTITLIEGVTIGGTVIGTLPPSIYFLPLALIGLRFWQARTPRQTFGLVLAFLALLIALFLVLGMFSPSGEVGPLAITRPNRIPIPFLWIAVVLLYRDQKHELAPLLIGMALLLLPALVVLWYSEGRYDYAALLGHAGKLIARLFFLFTVMQIAARDIAQRIAAERGLRDLNETLEARVAERTVHLEREMAARTKAEARIRIELSRMNLLNSVAHAIGKRHDLRSIYQVVIRCLETEMPADFACVLIHRPVENDLTVFNVQARKREMGTRLGLHEGMHIGIDPNGLSQAMNGVLVYEPDLAGIAFPFPTRLVQAGLRSAIFAPVQYEDHVAGIMVCASARPDCYSSTDCEFLGKLSVHVALAARQGSLYQTLQRAYEDLQESQKAILHQERLRVLGQMASGIAHDINNAISPLSLYTQSLLEREQGLSKQMRDYLETVRRVVRDITETASRMRDFYRRPDDAVEGQPVDLNKLMLQVVDFTRARWSDIPMQRGVVISVQTALDHVPAVLGVESEIRDMLVNLIFNAVDALPSGGSIFLSTHAGAGRVVVEISDTGVGMDEETRKRCLEPFFTTKGERGSGLGLATVYGTAQRHGAEIELESSPGQGTSFRLVFHRLAGEERPVPQEVHAPGRPLRLLMIDDDPSVLQSTQFVLALDGHQIEAAGNGPDGIAAFRRALEAGQPHDVVITDLGLPYMDGREVAQNIKTLSPHTPVVLLTGWGRRLKDGKSEPFIDFVLAKPPDLDQLRETLAAASADRQC
jgi:signal transduction histidine kinase/ActR/RegA family two-component response regulator